MAFDANKYSVEYKRENYDQINIRIPKGKRELLKQTAKEWDIRDNRGVVSVSQLFIKAVERQYGIDLSRPDKD